MPCTSTKGFRRDLEIVWLDMTPCHVHICRWHWPRYSHLKLLTFFGLTQTVSTQTSTHRSNYVCDFKHAFCVSKVMSVHLLFHRFAKTVLSPMHTRALPVMWVPCLAFFTQKSLELVRKHASTHRSQVPTLHWYDAGWRCTIACLFAHRRFCQSKYAAAARSLFEFGRDYQW